MSHLIIVKYFQREADASTLEIALDKELASLATVLPTETIKRFSPVDGQKGVYRAQMSSQEQDFLSILKALRMMKWHTISSHVIVRPNAEETRFYMERELHRMPGANDHSSPVDDHALDRQAQAQLPMRQAPRPAGAAPLGEDGKVKRPTLSAAAAANIIGSNATAAPTAASAPFGFSQRNSLVARRPGPGSENPAPGSPPSATEHAPQADSPPSHTAPSTAGPAPAHPAAPQQVPHGVLLRGLSANQLQGHPPHSISQSRPPLTLGGRANAAPTSSPSQPASGGAMGVVAGFAQRIMLRSTSNQAVTSSATASPPSASSSATTSATTPLPEPAPDAVATHAASQAVPPTPASESAATDPAASKPTDSKNSSSVVSKLMGKYNRKSFISTTKIVVPPLEEENGAPPAETSTTAATSSSTSHAAAGPPPAETGTAAIPVAVALPVSTTTTTSSTTAAAAAPSAPPPPYEAVAQAPPPPYSSITAVPVNDDLEAFLSVNAMSVEESHDLVSPTSYRDDERTVHFSKRDLTSPGKYSPIQRDNADAHEISKTQHYSRLGSAFVNESSLNSLMGRGRGGRLGSMYGRSGGGRGLN